MVYTRDDLSIEQAEQLRLAYSAWKKKYGALPERSEAMLRSVLGVRHDALEELAILDMISAEERLNGEMLVAGRGSYVERWACRWLREGA